MREEGVILCLVRAVELAQVEHLLLPMLLMCALKLGKDVGGEDEERNKDEGEPLLADSEHLRDMRHFTPSAEAGDDMVWLAWVLKEKHHLQPPRSHPWLTPHNSGALDKTTPDTISVNDHSGEDINRVMA